MKTTLIQLLMCFTWCPKSFKGSGLIHQRLLKGKCQNYPQTIDHKILNKLLYIYSGFRNAVGIGLVLVSTSKIFWFLWFSVVIFSVNHQHFAVTVVHLFWLERFIFICASRTGRMAQTMKGHWQSNVRQRASITQWWAMTFHNSMRQKNVMDFLTTRSLTDRLVSSWMQFDYIGLQEIKEPWH